MEMAIIHSRANNGIEAVSVTVETHISRGLPKFTIVGLPEASVKESKDRVRSAIINSHFEFPRSRIVVNLAPADIPKEGSRFDLPIALSILAASKQITTTELMRYEFIGELALSGEIRPVFGVLPAAIACHQVNRTLIISQANLNDIAFIEGLAVSPATHLLEICEHFNDGAGLPYFVTRGQQHNPTSSIDMAEVQGQHLAKRALEIAAAGNHSLLMVGSPGSGKTMLANRLATIIPALNNQQAMEVAAIQSVSKQSQAPAWRQRPFRAPHHTASYGALVGGGNPPSPGEVSLAHHGILFLDELPEFKRHVLETLREPLEAGVIKISRAAHFVEYPANFQFVAAMNPCPCGYSLQKSAVCMCSDQQIQRYRAKISGPLLDRIDMIIELAPVKPEQLLTVAKSESSLDIKKRVIRAQMRQLQDNGLLNSQRLAKTISLDSHLTPYCQQLISQYQLSARAYGRIVKIARTIADLDESEQIDKNHLNEAITLRQSAQLFNRVIV